MIRRCAQVDFEKILEVINNSASAYKGVIPSNCWKEPYMSRDELKGEIDDGVEFWCYEEEGELLGVMGLQNVLDIALIRHSYVCREKWNQGIGGRLLSLLHKKTNRPILVGTWKEADWAVRFYEKNGFQKVSSKEKDLLLKKYWKIPDHQIENSVVLVNEKWWGKQDV